MELWNDVIEAFMKQGWGNGVLAERRKQQTLSWVYTMVEEHLHNLFYRSPRRQAHRDRRGDPPCQRSGWNGRPRSSLKRIPAYFLLRRGISRGGAFL